MPDRLRSLRVVATMHRNVAGSDSDSRDLIETLRRVIADLELLNQNTEQDFLKIGGKLGEFVQVVKGISSILTELTKSITGDQGLRASQALQQALDRSSESRARAEEGTRLLVTIRQEADRLTRTLLEYHATISTFHTLAVLTRIETARLGSAGAKFGNLAEEVKALAGSIQNAVESNLETAGLLIPSIAGAIHDIATVEAGQSKELPSVISGVLASLESFRVKQDCAHDSSVRLLARYDAISKAFGKLIVSIQFHDITRQQVEHVIEVLRRICAEPEDEGIGDARNRRRTVAILALQSSQLADAGEKFAASVASIAGSLQNIATHVLEMADESRTLAGLSEDEKNSFFFEMEAGCTVILASLQHCASADAATRASTGGLAGTIDRMRRSIEDIQESEHQMVRMALNARIGAFHSGPVGNALEVLGGLVQQLAFECSERSASIVEGLATISDAATRLSRQGSSATESKGGGQDDGYLDGMRTAVAELHSSSERSVVQITQIIDCGAHLREDLSETSQSFSAGAIFADAIGRACQMLKEAEGRIPSGLAAEEEDSGLADFAMHYTMQAERDVYDGLTKMTAVAVPANVPSESLLEHSAILDEKGTILKVNDAWRRFGQENQLRSPDSGVGLNYLRLCDTAEGDAAGDARRIAKGIRDVLNRQIEEYSHEYHCDSPLERRWFLVHVTRFVDADGMRVTVVHRNITHRKLAEEEMRRSREAAEHARGATGAFPMDLGHGIPKPAEVVATMTEAFDVEDLGDNVELF